jgi:hypothetical protein
MSESRKDVLLKALEAEVGGESVDLSTLFTDDVVGWSPYASVSGLEALSELSALREIAFSNVVIMFRGLDEVGNKAFAEWIVEADHTGPLVLGEERRGSNWITCQVPRRLMTDFRSGKIGRTGRALLTLAQADRRPDKRSRSPRRGRSDPRDRSSRRRSA